MNPTIKKKGWSVEEDVLLFKSVITIGKKWSRISKLFDGARNEHSVKNRYNALLHKYKSKSSKFTVSVIETHILRELEKKLKRLQKKAKK